MKATPLLIAWHNDSNPIYSAHFEPHGKGRLATAGGDHNVRLWRVDGDGEERKVTYLSTLSKHTEAVNVVRWCPRGTIILSRHVRVPADTHEQARFLAQQATTVTSSSGFHPKVIHTPQPLAKTH
ncbi:Chromatin assembly factor 1 subunit [Elasticomyces elasticus]|nr:Chromatin assembly factor 1 subunit [Elasticomyces elasticus]KAK4990147.1 Chromatin assembly factor 1 subunit [Elasticomyces elasticus]